jgi:hypothetical protein
MSFRMKGAGTFNQPCLISTLGTDGPSSPFWGKVVQEKLSMKNHMAVEPGDDTLRSPSAFLALR